MKRTILIWVILCFGMTLNSYAQKLPKSLDRGLVAYYKMDATGQDESSNQNHGYLNGGITPVKDRFGNDCSALHFNGYNSFIQVPDSKSISNVTEELTVSTWFKLGQGNEYSGLKWLTVVCKSRLERNIGITYKREEEGSDNCLVLSFVCCQQTVRSFSLPSSLSKRVSFRE